MHSSLPGRAGNASGTRPPRGAMLQQTAALREDQLASESLQRLREISQGDDADEAALALAVLEALQRGALKPARHDPVFKRYDARLTLRDGHSGAVVIALRDKGSGPLALVEAGMRMHGDHRRIGFRIAGMQKTTNAAGVKATDAAAAVRMAAPQNARVTANLLAPVHGAARHRAGAPRTRQRPKTRYVPRPCSGSKPTMLRTQAGGCRAASRRTARTGRRGSIGRTADSEPPERWKGAPIPRSRL